MPTRARHCLDRVVRWTTTSDALSLWLSRCSKDMPQWLQPASNMDDMRDLLAGKGRADHGGGRGDGPGVAHAASAHSGGKRRRLQQSNERAVAVLPVAARKNSTGSSSLSNAAATPGRSRSHRCVTGSPALPRREDPGPVRTRGRASRKPTGAKIGSLLIRMYPSIAHRMPPGAPGSLAGALFWVAWGVFRIGTVRRQSPGGSGEDSRYLLAFLSLLHRTPLAAIRHMRHLDPGHLLEQLAGKMRAAAGTGGCHGHFAGVRLGIGDERRHRFCRR